MPLTTQHDLELSSHSVEQTHRLGAHLGALLAAGDVIALQGELGAGKTNFVQGMARGLHIDDVVHSPTFILANEYRGGRVPLYHIDAYRVSDAREARGFGLDDYLNGEGVTVIEWAERIRAALPSELLWIELLHAGESVRHLRISASGAHYQTLLDQLQASLSI